MQHRRALSHGIFDGEDGGQDFVLDRDQVECLFGAVDAGGTDGGDRMPFVERFIAGEDIAEGETEGGVVCW